MFVIRNLKTGEFSSGRYSATSPNLQKARAFATRGTSRNASWPRDDWESLEVELVLKAPKSAPTKAAPPPVEDEPEPEPILFRAQNP